MIPQWEKMNARERLFPEHGSFVSSYTRACADSTVAKKCLLLYIGTSVLFTCVENKFWKLVSKQMMIWGLFGLKIISLGNS